MTNNVQVKLRDFSLGIIGALQSGIRPASMQRSYSPIGIGDYCTFAASAINHLINESSVQQSEKKECAIFMVNIFMSGIGQRLTTSELNEIANEIVKTNTIESNFAGILATMRMAR